MFHRNQRPFSKPTSGKKSQRPLIEPLEGRQLLSAVDLGVQEVRTPLLPATLKAAAAPRGMAVVVLQNNGSERFKGPIRIDLQLSPDGQWDDDANPALRTVYRRVIPLRVGGRRVFHIRLPSIPSGIVQDNYRIAAKITVAGEQAADTLNNTGAGWRTTFTGTPGVSPPVPGADPVPDPTPRPEPTPDPAATYVDLAVDPDIAVTRAESGSTATMTVTVTNVGTKVARGPLSFDLWAGPNANDSDGDLYVGGGGATLIDLDPGESMTFTETVEVPTEFVGIAYYKAELYDVSVIDLEDVNRDNDQTATGPVEIWAYDVDLSATWAFADAPTESVLPVQVGDVVKLRLDVTNHGTETFTGPVGVSLATRPQGLWMPTSKVEVTLAAGETRSVELTFTVSPLLDAGDYELFGNVVVNYNEGPGGRANNDMPDGLFIRVQ